MHSIDDVRAVQAVSLSEMGFSQQDISEQVGISRRTISDILNGIGHWGQLAERPIFAKQRAEQSKALEAAARSFAAQSWAKAAEKMDSASYYQLVMGGAILIDKARLLAGESTANVEVHSKVEIAGLDQLCSALSQVLLETTVSQSRTVDTSTTSGT
jgi:transcriptional regulator with XRE-family HTH domain